MSHDHRLADAFFAYVAVLLYLSIGAATLPQLGWYRTLSLPALSLSPLAVSVAWLIIFLSGGLSAMAYWNATRSAPTRRTAAVYVLYAVIAVLLVLWNYLFFGAHLLMLAAVAALAITFSTMVLMLATHRDVPNASLRLVPFLLWMVYATYFTYAVSLLNP